MRILHDSHNENYRKPFGAVPEGSKVSLSIYAPEALSVQLRLLKDGEEEQLIAMARKLRKNSDKESNYFSVDIKVPDEPCVLWYFFVIKTEETELCYGLSRDGFAGPGEVYICEEPGSYHITVYKKAQVPEWYKDSIVYQIFPDRWARSADFDKKRAAELLDDRGAVKRELEKDWYKPPANEFGTDNEICRWKFYGGSLNGIRENLQYIKSLGVTCIYLNPIFRARSTHRYDTTDYMSIDPLLGTEEDFKMLCAAAEEQGIRIILDGVFNHCGADSIYFDRFDLFGCGAYKREHSKYRKWFTFYGDEDYRSWWNIKDLPDFDTANEEYIDFITGHGGVLKKWLSLGAFGWRLDVADELPNEFLKKIRKSIKEEDPEYVLMGEVWDDASCKHDYGHLMEFLLGEELDCTMNYPFRKAVLPYVKGDITAGEMVRQFMSLAENYPPENLYGCLNLLGSHDRERILNVLGGYPMAREGFDHETEYQDLTKEEYELAVNRYKMLSILQYCMPGVPDIYYGDEAGLQGGVDPDNRRAYPWGREDMDLVEHFRWLGSFYHEHPCLKNGGFELSAVDDNVLALERFNDDERILILINRSDKYYDIEYKGIIYDMWAYDGKIVFL